MAVAITHPKQNAKLNGLGTRLLVASGRADPSSVGVFGKCTSQTNPRVTADGTLVSFQRERRKASELPFYRWTIHFELPQDDTYELAVISFDQAGNPSRPDKRIFQIAATHGILIAWPVNGEILTGLEADFVPYGTLGANAFQSASMTSAGGQNIAVLSSFSDNVDLMFWSAQFDTLVHDGTPYTLTVLDTGGGTDVKNQLVV